MPFVPQHTDLFSLLRSSVAIYGGQPLFGSRTGDGWQWTSYEAFGAMVDQCRSGLAVLGVNRGDRVAVIARNRLEWAVTAYASHSLCAVYVPVHYSQLERDWKYVLQDSGAKVCFVGDKLVEERVRALQADLHALESIVCFEGNTDDSTSFSYLMKCGAEHPVPPRVPEDRKEVASFIYTAGISGTPKGVQLTHFNLASNACAVIEASPARQSELTVSILPWSHVLGGAIELNVTIGTGGAMAICDNPSQLLETMREVRPTGLFAVPRIWNHIRDDVLAYVAEQSGFFRNLFHRGMWARAQRNGNRRLTLKDKAALSAAEYLVFPRIQQRLGGRLRFASSGAAALPRQTEAFLENIGIRMYQGYGLTECSGCATTNGVFGVRAGSVGKPVPGVTVRIDTNVETASKDEGEVVVFGTGVMAGYHNLPGDTLETITKYGGVRTGDLGRIDEDGFLYITGTLKELYKLANGRYVAPTALEAALLGIPYVAQCMVYGANQAYNVALIVPDMVALMAWARASDMGPFVDTLLEDARTRQLFEEEIAKQSRAFEGYEQIRNFALLRKEFSSEDGTLTPTLKLKRRNIVDKYRDTLKQLYA